MSFWSEATIISRGNDVVSDFKLSLVDCNSYRLRMGNEYYSTSEHGKSMDDCNKREILAEKESFTISPGQFGFLLTLEIVTLPEDVMAFISMRSTIKFRGLINVSGFHIDPGYSGRLIFSVFNAGPSPIHISQGEELFLIWFANLDIPTKPRAAGKKPKAGYTSIPSNFINGMNREMTSIYSIEREVKKIENRMNLQATIFGFAVALFTSILVGVIWFTLNHGLVPAVKGFLTAPAVVHSIEGVSTMPPAASPPGTPQEPPFKEPPPKEPLQK